MNEKSAPSRATIRSIVGGGNAYVAAGVFFLGLILMLSWGQLSAWATARPTGDRLLLSAAAQGDRVAAQNALFDGATPDAQSEAGFTTLYFAAASGDTSLVRALLYRGANPNSAAGAGWTPLAAAATTGGDPELVATLLEAGSDPNAVVSEAGITPLILAAKYGHQEIVELLLDAGANVNRRTRFGESALLAAILNESATPVLVRTLIDAGIDIHAEDVDGVTALKAAQSTGRQDLAAILMDSAAVR